MGRAPVAKLPKGLLEVGILRRKRIVFVAS
jgi:hypothetical protein